MVLNQGSSKLTNNDFGKEKNLKSFLIKTLTTLATTTEQLSEPDKETRSPSYVEDENHANAHLNLNAKDKDDCLVHFKITFSTALAVVPAEDWCRTWASDRTIMLRMTSKSVKEVVDKMSLPAVVRLSRSFWDDARNGTAAEMLQFVMSQLTALTAHCRISTLELPRCKTCCLCNARLAGVLAQCPALAHLNLTYNAIAPGCTCGMKRKMCTISADLEHRIEVLKSIVERIQLAQDSKDYAQIPSLQRDYKDFTNAW